MHSERILWAGPAPDTSGRNRTGTPMTELTISPDEIRSAIQNYVSDYSPDVSREEVGIVAETGDGIATVEGLPSAMSNELLEFPGGVLGVALNLDVRSIGAVILGDAMSIEEGQQVTRTGEVLSVPVGDAFLGRVVNPLAQPLAGLGAIAAAASDSAGFKWLAPYTGSAIGQHWMYQGKHVLIIFDDLSKQAEAYRAISLLLRRPPGREAYPGDVFYLHSRLLERCAKLSDELGAGSMTGLPIIETKAGDVSAYIPTNVISITDGQCFLEGDLFNAGVRPAINVGISVSRVGGAAQVKAMRKVSGTLRLDLSAYRELEAFAAFGSDLDAASKQSLARGSRLVELLKQGQFSPYPVEEQVVSIWAGTRGHLDRVPVQDIRRFESEYLQYLRHAPGAPLEAIRTQGDLSDETEKALIAGLGEFSDTFTTSEGVILGRQAEVQAMDKAEVDQEKVQVRRAAAGK